MSDTNPPPGGGSNDDPWSDLDAPPASAPEKSAGAAPARSQEYKSVQHPAESRSRPGPASESTGDDVPPAAAPEVKRVRENERKSIGILGFSSSGKTVYLAMLYHATQERKLFPPEWHANWAIDNGFSRGYLSRISRMMRGIDRRGRTAFIDATRTAVRREFPRGNVEVTPIEFELYRKWGLTNRPLKVLTQDGMGEAIHNAATDGPDNLPPEQREIWLSTLELCRNSSALLFFVNLVKFEDSDYASDVSFLVDWLLRAGMKPKAVAIVAPGLDSWDGVKSRDELKALVREKFVNSLESLTRAGVPVDIFPVSSVGKHFVRQSDQVGPDSSELGQIINPSPKAEPHPEYIDEPWEFIFRRTIPRWAQYETLAVIVDAIWLFRRRFLNKYALSLYALLLLGAFVAWPWWRGRTGFTELVQLAPQATTIAQVRHASELYDSLAANRVWSRLNAVALTPLAPDRDRWADLLGIEQLQESELQKASPDYVALVDKVNAYVNDPRSRTAAGIHPYINSLPLTKWRVEAARLFLKSPHPIKDKLQRILDLYQAGLTGYEKEAAEIAAEGARLLEEFRQERVAFYSGIKDDRYADPDVVEVQREELRDIRQMAGSNVFIPVPGYQQVKPRLDELNILLHFISDFARANKDLRGLPPTDPKRLEIARTIWQLREKYAKVSHPLLDACPRRATDIRKDYELALKEGIFGNFPAAVTSVDRPYSEFASALAYWSEHRADILPADRKEIDDRRQSTLIILGQKLTGSVVELEANLATLTADPDLVAKGLPACQKFQGDVRETKEAYATALKAGLPADRTLETRLDALTRAGDALNNFMVIATSPDQTAAQQIALGNRLGLFARENSQHEGLSRYARALAADYARKGAAAELTERFAELEDPDGAAKSKFTPEQLEPVLAAYNAFIAEPRFAARRSEAIARRFQLISRYNVPDLYYAALQNVLRYPADTEELRRANIDLANKFLADFPHDARADTVREIVQVPTPAVSLNFTRLKFSPPLDGVAEIVITQTTPQGTRELARLSGVRIRGGELESAAQVKVRIGGPGEVRIACTFREAPGGTVLAQSSKSYPAGELQPGAAKVGALDDRQTLIRLQVTR